MTNSTRIHILLAMTALAVSGCATTPSPLASKVVEADSAQVANCKFLGTVVGRSIWSDPYGLHNTATNNAMVDLQEKVAAMGGTHYVLMNLDSGGQFTTASAPAKAYKCR